MTFLRMAIIVIGISMIAISPLLYLLDVILAMPISLVAISTAHAFPIVILEGLGHMMTVTLEMRYLITSKQMNRLVWASQ